MSVAISRTLGTESPSFWACCLGLLLGLGLVGGGLYLFAKAGTPAPLNTAVVLLGLTELATAYFALHHNRVAWAFALSINGTVATVLVFSAPRIRDWAEISIGVAMVPAVIFGILTLLHALKPEDF